jgi:uncharacterized membrane protein
MHPHITVQILSCYVSVFTAVNLKAEHKKRGAAMLFLSYAIKKAMLMIFAHNVWTSR